MRILNKDRNCIIQCNFILFCFTHLCVILFTIHKRTIVQTKKQQRHLCSNRISHSPSLSLEFLLLINQFTSCFRTHIVTLSDTTCVCVCVQNAVATAVRLKLLSGKSCVQRIAVEVMMMMMVPGKAPDKTSR